MVGNRAGVVHVSKVLIGVVKAVDVAVRAVVTVDEQVVAQGRAYGQQLVLRHGPHGGGFGDGAGFLVVGARDHEEHRADHGQRDHQADDQDERTAAMMS